MGANSVKLEPKALPSRELPSRELKRGEIQLPGPWTIGSGSDQCNIYGQYLGPVNSVREPHGLGDYVGREKNAGEGYSGDWSNGNMTGKGCWQYQNRAIYYGEFVNGYPHGHGVFYSADSKVCYDGVWNNGAAEGKGRMLLEGEIWNVNFSRRTNLFCRLPVPGIWTWGPFEPINIRIENSGLTARNRDGRAPDYSCVLGSETFTKGVHTWVLQVSNVQSLWLGISRGVEEAGGLREPPGRHGQYLLCFSSGGSVQHRGVLPKVQTISSSGTGFSSGDRVKFVLDCYDRSLSMSVNDDVKIVCTDVDCSSGVVPYMCSDYKESVTILDRRIDFETGEVIIENFQKANKIELVGVLNKVKSGPHKPLLEDRGREAPRPWVATMVLPGGVEEQCRLVGLTKVEALDENYREDDDSASAPTRKEARLDGAASGRGGETELLSGEEIRQVREAAREEVSAEESKIFEPVYKLKTGHPAEAAQGLENRMCIQNIRTKYHERIGKEMDGIQEEVDDFASSSSDPRAQEVKEMLRYIRFEESSEKQYKNGSIRDRGRGKVNFSYFKAHQKAQIAKLSDAEILAMRLYTTIAFLFMNTPLRDDERYALGEPCPLSVTTYFAWNGVKKLRALHVDSGQVTLWRGMRNLEVADAFMERGGTELAFMSTTLDLRVAVRFCLSQRSLLFKIVSPGFMTMGADVQWLSTFPGEAEILYPPLTYLKATGRSQVVEFERDGKSFSFTVVEVQPQLS